MPHTWLPATADSNFTRQCRDLRAKRPRSTHQQSVADIRRAAAAMTASWHCSGERRGAASTAARGGRGPHVGLVGLGQLEALPLGLLPQPLRVLLGLPHLPPPETRAPLSCRCHIAFRSPPSDGRPFPFASMTGVPTGVSLVQSAAYSRNKSRHSLVPPSALPEWSASDHRPDILCASTIVGIV